MKQRTIKTKSKNYSMEKFQTDHYKYTTDIYRKYINSITKNKRH